jgi:hypothetical protein
LATYEYDCEGTSNSSGDVIRALALVASGYSLTGGRLQELNEIILGGGSLSGGIVDDVDGSGDVLLDGAVGGSNSGGIVPIVYGVPAAGGSLSGGDAVKQFGFPERLWRP